MIPCFYNLTPYIQCPLGICITLSSLFTNEVSVSSFDPFWKPHSEDSYGSYLHRHHWQLNVTQTWRLWNSPWTEHENTLQYHKCVLCLSVAIAGMKLRWSDYLKWRQSGRRWRSCSVVDSSVHIKEVCPTAQADLSVRNVNKSLWKSKFKEIKKKTCRSGQGIKMSEVENSKNSPGFTKKVFSFPLLGLFKRTDVEFPLAVCF